MSGSKPRFKVAIKPASEGAKNRGLMAFWERDDGKGLSGKFDRDVKRVWVEYEDGSRHKIERDREGRFNYYVNGFENDDGAPQATKRMLPNDAAHVDFPEGDDIPFDRFRRRGEQ